MSRLAFLSAKIAFTKAYIDISVLVEAGETLCRGLDVFGRQVSFTESVQKFMVSR
jgi:hypothetical protein